MVETIQKAANTGKIDDGEIFVLPGKGAFSLRAGMKGEVAILEARFTDC